MKDPNKKEQTTSLEENIIDWYVEDVLEGKIADNVYLFCKNHKIDEPEFYGYFNGFDAIESRFLALLLDKTIEIIEKDKNYGTFAGREKLLSLYYTFIGNLTQNRSFVLYLFRKGHFGNLKKLTPLRKRFIEYVKAINIEKIDLPHEKLVKLRDRSLAEAVWVQFLSIIKFWLKDDSAGFEKTDVYIEKSTVAGFELINTKPLKSVLDLGKFLWKEISPMA